MTMTANNKQPSFSPLLFIISAFGGNDEQCSEAGIQLYISRPAQPDTIGGSAAEMTRATPLDLMTPMAYYQQLTPAPDFVSMW